MFCMAYKNNGVTERESVFCKRKCCYEIEWDKVS